MMLTTGVVSLYLKPEFLPITETRTYQEGSILNTDTANRNTLNCIEMFSNPVRGHIANNLLSPHEFERRYKKRLISAYRDSGDSATIAMFSEIIRHRSLCGWIASND